MFGPQMSGFLEENLVPSDPACMCDARHRGLACQIRQCPGLPECGGPARGSCSASATGEPRLHCTNGGQREFGMVGSGCLGWWAAGVWDSG